MVVADEDMPYKLFIGVCSAYGQNEVAGANNNIVDVLGYSLDRSRYRAAPWSSLPSHLGLRFPQKADGTSDHCHGHLE